ncbi:uncharacterized protein LOC128929751 [Callithrix jacchus]
MGCLDFTPSLIPSPVPLPPAALLPLSAWPRKGFPEGSKEKPPLASTTHLLALRPSRRSPPPCPPELTWAACSSHGPALQTTLCTRHDRPVPSSASTELVLVEDVRVSLEEVTIYNCLGFQIQPLPCQLPGWSSVSGKTR